MVALHEKSYAFLTLGLIDTALCISQVLLLDQSVSGAMGQCLALRKGNKLLEADNSAKASFVPGVNLVSPSHKNSALEKSMGTAQLQLSRIWLGGLGGGVMVNGDGKLVLQDQFLSLPRSTLLIPCRYLLLLYFIYRYKVTISQVRPGLL